MVVRLRWVIHWVHQVRVCDNCTNQLEQTGGKYACVQCVLVSVRALL
jgi:hypothetical protein